MWPCTLCPARSFGPFATAAPVILTELCRLKSIRRFHEGHRLFYEGESAPQIYCILRGFAKIEKLGGQSDPVIIEIVGPGALLGMDAAFDGRMHHHAAYPLADVSACVFSATAFLDLIGRFPSLDASLLRYAALRSRLLEIELAIRTSYSAQERITKLLQRLTCDSGGINAGDPLILELLSRRDMGAMTGLAPETVSRVMSELRTQPHSVPVAKTANVQVECPAHSSPSKSDSKS